MDEERKGWMANLMDGWIKEQREGGRDGRRMDG
jgi:hypothetical protein